MAATDRFGDRNPSVIQSARKCFAITPHDTTELTYVTTGIYVGGAGDVKIIAVDDSVAVTFADVPAGTILPVQARIVHTDTAATGLIGMVG